MAEYHKILKANPYRDADGKFTSKNGGGGGGKGGDGGVQADVKAFEKEFNLKAHPGNPKQWNAAKGQSIYVVPGKAGQASDARQSLKKKGFVTEDKGKNFDKGNVQVQVDTYKGALWVSIRVD